MLKLPGWWTEAHQDAWRRSIGLLVRQPWSSVMTVVMLAVTLMLAVLCWMATHHLSELNAYWHRSETISLYLRPSLSESEQQLLLKKIRAMPEVESATLTTPAEGLILLAQQEGMQDIVQSLPYNPLPAVIQVIPGGNVLTPETVKQFSQTLQSNPDVAEVKFDSDWIERLYAGLGFLKQIVHFLTVLFGLSVTLVIGNTLRLLIHHRHNDIHVLQLLGAPERFIMRPFLFASIWYGLLASILAIIFVDILLILLRSGLNQWAESYHMHLSISLLPLLWMIGLTAVSIALSWTGARLTLKYYL